MTQPFTEDISGCFGTGTLDKQQYQKTLASLDTVFAEIKNRSCPQTKALLELPAKTDDLEAIQSLADELRKQCDDVVVVGSGGSGLSGEIFARLCSGNTQPALHFLENIDPDLTHDVLARLKDIQRTVFIIVSKSGTTVETLSHFYVLCQHAAGDRDIADVANQFIIITTADDNPLCNAARQYGMHVFDHPEDIGGRFSALSVVGLLPAALCGADIRAVRKGASILVSQLDNATDVAQCPGTTGAALHYTAYEAGKNISVMWPYGERLAGFAAWYRQSWAESLGKGGKGSTPLMAMGTTDQHSQLQLFLDGPKDKLFHLITINRAGSGEQITAPEPLSHINGKTLGDVMQAQQDATIATLKKNHCPVRVLSLPALNEESFGALLMLGVLEIIYMAALLQVNPFDQPAVEDSKNLARASLLGEVA